MKVDYPFDYKRCSFEIHPLLQLCCNVLDPLRTAQIGKILQQNLNWSEILEDACKEGIAPLVYLRLASLGYLHCLPEQVIESLKLIFYRQLMHNTFIYRELNLILDRLHDKKVHSILLKGVALADIIYSNIALRCIHDIDLLIRLEDRKTLHMVLITLGYHPEEDLATVRQCRHQLWTGHLTPYVKNVGRFRLYIEPHFSLVPPHSPHHLHLVSTEHIWDSAIVVQGKHVTTTSIPCPEDLLIHQCSHITKHIYQDDGYSRLIWWYDLIEIERFYRAEINWDRLIRRSELHGLREWIYDPLMILKTNFGVPIPKLLSQRLSCGEVTSTKSPLSRCMHGLTTQNMRAGHMKGLLAIRSAASKALSKLYLIRRALFPPKNFIMLHYKTTSSDLLWWRFYFHRFYNGLRSVIEFMFESYVIFRKTNV